VSFQTSLVAIFGLVVFFFLLLNRRENLSVISVVFSLDGGRLLVLPPTLLWTSRTALLYVGLYPFVSSLTAELFSGITYLNLHRLFHLPPSDCGERASSGVIVFFPLEKKDPLSSQSWPGHFSWLPILRLKIFEIFFTSFSPAPHLLTFCREIVSKFLFPLRFLGFLFLILSHIFPPLKWSPKSVLYITIGNLSPSQYELH